MNPWTLQVCVTLAFVGAVTSVNDDDSLRLAWAVRKLVGNCSRAYDDHSKLRAMEETMRNMKSSYPEAFCLMGMKSGEIPDRDITASSDHGSGYCEITNSRLDRYGGWCAGANNPPNQWIEVDLGYVRNVTGVVTQAAVRSTPLSEWITGFKVQYGTVFGSRGDLTVNGLSKVFTPVNFDAYTKVVTRFPEAIAARYVRIVPTTYHNHISMRFDLINC